MAGKKGWVRVEGGKEHPENSILLAYTRKQQLEDRLGIRRHIEECPSCFDKCDEFERDSMVLGALKQMQSRLDYADVPPEQVFSRLQAEAARYERRLSTRVMRYFEPMQRFGKRSLRVVPRIGQHLKPERPLSSMGFYMVSLLIVLTLLLTLVGVFAAFHGGGLFNQQPIRPVVTLVVQHNVKPTARPNPTATFTVSTGAGQSAEHIRDCTTNEDRKQSQLRICGSNFKPGNKVALLVTMSWAGQPRQRHPVVVDGHGKFVMTIQINNCNVPVAIVAHDLTNTGVYSNTLQGIKFGGCRIPSSNFGAGRK